jgi:predicted O-methyltransferase YrrM
MNKNFMPAMGHLRNTPCTYLEIGVFLGTTAKWVLENILTHPDAHLIGIDPWERKLYPRHEIRNDGVWDNLVKGIDEIGKNPKVRWIKGYSQNVINERYGFSPLTIDAVYIDGEHSTAAVMKDFQLSWPLLKVGGIMIFDDYCSKAPGSSQVKGAIDYIVNRFKEEIDVLFKNRQVGIRRTA